MSRLELYDLRNVREARLGLGPGLNVLLGRNAQGKTSVLEAVGLLSRARSFRSDPMVDQAVPETGTAGTAVPAD